MSRQTRMLKFILVLELVTLCLSLSAGADDWGAPTPVSFNSRGFGHVAEVFPPGSRQNPSKRPLCASCVASWAWQSSGVNCALHRR